MNPDAAKHFTGGPAFPNNYEADKINEPGLSIRDYFAAKAMQGWITSKPNIMGEALNGGDEMAAIIARAAYVMADAMLEASK